MKISVIIPAYNGAGTLCGCLEALLRSNCGPETEVLVIDDGSTDSTPQLVKAAIDAAPASGPRLRLLQQSHRGASAARNRGIQEAQGEVVVFTDSDCRPRPDWIRRLTAPLLSGPGDSSLRADEQVVSSEPIGDGGEDNRERIEANQQPDLDDLLDRHGRPETPVGSVGRCLSDQSHWVAALIQIELDERYSTMGRHARVDFLNTGNCAFRREVLAGMRFDEGFRWLEDVEFSYRLARGGHEMVFVPEAVVHHSHPESFWSYLKRKFHYASYAPEIYRRFPGKAFIDSRTPINRKLQLVALGLGIGGMAGSLGGILIGSVFSWGLAFDLAAIALLPSALLLGLSVLFSLPVVARACRQSIGLGILAPFFVLSGNLAFVLGSLSGVVRKQPER